MPPVRILGRLLWAYPTEAAAVAEVAATDGDRPVAEAWTTRADSDVTGPRTEAVDWVPVLSAAPQPTRTTADAKAMIALRARRAQSMVSRRDRRRRRCIGRNYAHHPGWVAPSFSSYWGWMPDKRFKGAVGDEP